MRDPDHPKHARPDHEILDRHPAALEPARVRPVRVMSARRPAAACSRPRAGRRRRQRTALAFRRHDRDAIAGALRGAGRVDDRAQPGVGARGARADAGRGQDDDRANGQRRTRTRGTTPGQAVAFLTLQATAMGLSIRQMAGLRSRRASAACRVADVVRARGVVIAIGYAGDPDDSQRAAPSGDRSTAARAAADRVTSSFEGA